MLAKFKVLKVLHLLGINSCLGVPLSSMLLNLAKNHTFQQQCRNLNEQTRQRLQIFIKQKLKNDQIPHEPIDYLPSLLIDKTSIDVFFRNKLVRSIGLKEPSIIIDFRNIRTYRHYDDLRRLGVSISNVFHSNRMSSQPFQMNFSNYDYSSEFHQVFSNVLDFDREFIFDSKDSYINHFPKDRLVYISMNANAKMTRFDPSRVYIINASPKNSLGHRSYAQARKDGISCQRLPIDDYAE